MPAKFAGAVRLYYTAELISVSRKKQAKKINGAPVLASG